MARSKGARNAAFHDRKLALAMRLRARLADGTLPRASFRELAQAAEVGVATLKHYFGDREQLVREVLEAHAAGGAPHFAMLRAPLADFAASIRAAADYVALGFGQQIVAELHLVGLAEGLGRPSVGASYLIGILEPAIEALETRLGAHVERGQMRPCDLRTAALALLSPLVLAHLHQGALGGCETRPLDLEAFRAEHCAAFVRAYRAEE